ncbi:hypothetical protein [Caballeronia sp. LZ043]|uniref:hypothetical protein n=1 Tax=Caballeronia sp. LZ043 TaxID=3038569 RepID=UPI0028649E9B|nr:hypothetical protein [Caballeronia sp. LZ043]MDR5822458.1 hypothetical protein [Caballeronia sp. LZ043]
MVLLHWAPSICCFQLPINQNEPLARVNVAVTDARLPKRLRPARQHHQHVLDFGIRLRARKHEATGVRQGVFNRGLVRLSADDQLLIADALKLRLQVVGRRAFPLAVSFKNAWFFS